MEKKSKKDKLANGIDILVLRCYYNICDYYKVERKIIEIYTKKLV